MTYNSTTAALTYSHFAVSSEMSICILRIVDFVAHVLAFLRPQTTNYIIHIGPNIGILIQTDVSGMRTGVVNVKLQVTPTVNVIT